MANRAAGRCVKEEEDKKVEGRREVRENRNIFTSIVENVQLSRASDFALDYSTVFCVCRFHSERLPQRYCGLHAHHSFLFPSSKKSIFG